MAFSNEQLAYASGSLLNEFGSQVGISRDGEGDADFRARIQRVAFPSGDGGMAFPMYFGGQVQPRGGMTLRDYFAAKIVQSLISSAKGEHNLGAPYPESNSNFAMAAYAVADAMLAERAK